MRRHVGLADELQVERDCRVATPINTYDVPNLVQCSSGQLSGHPSYSFEDADHSYHGGPHEDGQAAADQRSVLPRPERPHSWRHLRDGQPRRREGRASRRIILCLRRGRRNRPVLHRRRRRRWLLLIRRARRFRRPRAFRARVSHRPRFLHCGRGLSRRSSRRRFMSRLRHWLWRWRRRRRRNRSLPCCRRF
jgi:hypothetical protein